MPINIPEDGHLFNMDMDIFTLNLLDINDQFFENPEHRALAEQYVLGQKGTEDFENLHTPPQRPLVRQ